MPLYQVRFRWTCDRCRTVVTERAQEPRHPWQPPGWATLYKVDPPLGNLHGVDPTGVLCPTCLTDLDTWLATPPTPEP